MANKTDLQREDQIDERQAERFGDLANREERAGQDYIKAGIDQAEAFANDPKNRDESNLTGQARDAEQANPMNYAPGPSSQPLIKRLPKEIGMIIRRKKGATAAVSVFGIVGSILAIFFGQFSMLIHVAENLTDFNDSSSVSMERRFMKAFTFVSDNKLLCNTSSKSYKCSKSGKISNKALTKLEKRGIKPVFASGTKNINKRIGYPSKNPIKYEIDLGNGKKETVAADKLSEFMSKKENSKIANKVIGRFGAFSMRTRAWTGQHLSKRFSKLRGTPDGGIAGKRYADAKSSAERRTLFRKSIPTVKSLGTSANAITGRIEEKIGKNVGKAKKGGVGYTLAVAGCVGAKAPAYVAAGVAGVQLLQILPMVNDTVLSPASMAKASGYDDEFSPEGMDAAATLFTERGPRESDGKLTSALDSPYLLAAMGLNAAKLPLSKKFTPGFGVFSATKGLTDASKKTESACSAILNPRTMYTFAATDAAVTVALSATIIGGVLKVAASWAAADLAVRAAKNIGGALAKGAIENLAENDAIPTARYEAFGDLIGIASPAFFASAAMSRFIPTLSESQLFSYQEVREENEAFQRELALASLSPFDTSSKYTFLGNIKRQFSTALIKQGSTSTSIASMGKTILQLPGLMSNAALSPVVSAAGPASYLEYCSHADELGMNTGDPSTTPAMNFAGLPCTGLTTQQANMGTAEASDLMESEGWLDTSVELEDDDSIDDMLASGYIKEGTPLHDQILECGDASSGEYIYNSTGCIAPDATPTNNNNSSTDRCPVIRDEEGVEYNSCTTSTDVPASSEFKSPSSPKALSAISVFLIDHQIIQAINGEDDGIVGAEGFEEDDPLNNLPPSEGKYMSPVPQNMKSKVNISAPYGKYPSGGDHWGLDIASSTRYDFVSVCDGTVASISINASYPNSNARGISGSTNYVWIRCNDGVYVGYAHFYANKLKSYIKKGYKISAGTPIAQEGNQGNSSGFHLHLQVNPSSPGGYSASSTIDPKAYLARKGVSIP